MDFMHFEVIIRPDQIRNVAVTCACKKRTVHSVPSIFLDPKVEDTPALVLRCGCGQRYILYNRKLRRFDGLQVEETVVPEVATEDFIEEFDGSFLEGKIVQPGNKEVN